MAALELARTFGVATVESANVRLEIDGCMNLGSSLGAHPVRGTHLTGSEVTGALKISAMAPVPYRTITVTLKGEAEVQSFETNSQGEGGTWRSSTTEFMKEIVVLKESQTKGKSDELDKGSHNFPFQFQMNKENLPSSQKTYRVDIKYTLEAHLYKGLPVARVQFPYAGTVDITSEHLSRSVRVDKEKKLLFVSEPIRLSAELDRSGIQIGQMLNLRVNVENNSGRSLRLKAVIKQKQSYSIRNAGYYSKTWAPAKTVAKDTRDQRVDPHTSVDWEPEGLIVPQTEPTSMDSPRIHVTYFVRVRAKVPFGIDSIIDIPITVA